MYFKDLCSSSYSIQKYVPYQWRVTEHFPVAARSSGRVPLLTEPVSAGGGGGWAGRHGNRARVPPQPPHLPLTLTQTLLGPIPPTTMGYSYILIYL